MIVFMNRPDPTRGSNVSSITEKNTFVTSVECSVDNNNISKVGYFCAVFKNYSIKA